MYSKQKDLNLNETVHEANKREKCATFCIQRIIILLVLMICAIGSTYQIIEITILYFNYHTVTKVKIDRPAKLNPPSISICFFYIQLLDWNRVFTLFPELKSVAENISYKVNSTINFNNYQMRNYKVKPNSFDYYFTKYIETHYRTDQILSMTRDFSHLFLRCVVKDPESYFVIETSDIAKCRRILDIGEYMKDECKCFILTFKSITNGTHIYDLQELSNTFSWRNLLLQLRLNETVVGKLNERVKIIIHPSYRLPFGRLDPILIFRYPGRNVTYTLTYSRIINHLLKKPYDSNCISYEVSREKAVTDCIKKESLKKYGRIPYSIAVEPREKFKFFGYKKISEDKILSDNLNKIIKHCYQLIEQPDCILEIFRPEVVSETNGGSHLKIEVEIPSALDIDTTMTPQQTLLEYLIYNGSALGFWFGFAIVKFIDYFDFFHFNLCYGKKEITNGQ